MEPLLLFPDPPPPAVAAALTEAGYPFRPATTSDEATRLEPEDGWAGALICSDDDPQGAAAMCRHLRKRDIPLEPLLLVGPSNRLAALDAREHLFDDFCLLPLQAGELEARLKH